MRVSAIAELIRWLKTHGRSVEPLLQASGLAPFDLSAPGNVMPLLPASEFCKLVQIQEGPDIGARIVDSGTIHRLGTVTQVLTKGPTIRDSLVNLAIGFNVQATHAHLTVTSGVDRLTIRHFYSVPLAAEFLHLSQQFIAELFRTWATTTGAPEPVLDEVHIVPHPQYGIAHLRPHFGAALRASKVPSLSMVVRSVVADHRFASITGRNPEDPPEAWQTLRSLAPLTHSVRLILHQLLRDGEPPIRQIARISGLSVRTLQRRLLAEGVSFSELLDDVRREIILASLQQDDEGVESAGVLGGYHSPASVTRAVRRWTGESPRTLKRRGDTRVAKDKE